MPRNLRILSPLLLLVLATSAGCHGGAATKPAPVPGVSAPGLGITLGTIPDGLEVQSHSDDRIVLVPKDPTTGGVLTITAGSTEAGLNLQAAVKLHKEEIEKLPGGKYLGARELVGPTGTAYWSRGRFTRDGREMEEARIVTLDPSQQHILRLNYVYPAQGDSAKRVTTLLDVTGEIEASQAPTPAK